MYKQTHRNYTQSHKARIKNSTSLRSGNVCIESTKLKLQSNYKFMTYVYEQISLREKEEANLKCEMRDTPIDSLHFSV